MANNTSANVTINTILVHTGVFHADDAMCVALARIINPQVKVQRVFRAPDSVEEGTVICDIGFGRYDHHQPDARCREESGEKYAACGLLLEDVWQQIFPSEESYLGFVRDVIIPIERQDNGGERNPLSLAVSSFSPNWDEERSMDDAFMEAVEMLQGIVERRVAAAQSAIKAESIVCEALAASNGDVVVLSRFCPWQHVLAPSSARFVVFPSLRGGFNLQCVPEEDNPRGQKCPLPEEWLSNKPEGCTFVHAGRFMASFTTEEAALRAATLIG